MKTLTLHLLEFDRPYCFFFPPQTSLAVQMSWFCCGWLDVFTQTTGKRNRWVTGWNTQHSQSWQLLLVKVMEYGGSGCVCGLGRGKGRMRTETTQDKETSESRMKRKVYTDRQRDRQTELNTECRVTENSIFSSGSSFLCSKGRKTMRVIIHSVWMRTV